MSKELKAQSSVAIEQAVAAAITKLTGVEHKCKILGVNYPNSEKATIKMEISPTPYEERLPATDEGK